MNINYSVKRATNHKGIIVYRAYENNNYLDEFLTEERAWNYINTYRRLMR